LSTGAVGRLFIKFLESFLCAETTHCQKMYI
jgi:hypothetical protein